VLGVGFLLAFPAGAMADIVADDNVFVGSPFTLNPQGRVDTLVNQGTNPHNVTAQGRGPDGQPLFRSATISGGTPDPTTPVRGTQYLATGTYQFSCTIHLGMNGALEVGNGGKPVARPDIELTVVSRKLAKVAKKGKLVIRVQALTASNDVAISARLGKRQLGRKAGLNLAAGTARKVALKLGKKAKKILRKRKKAKLSVAGTVPFGAPDSAKRLLK